MAKRFRKKVVSEGVYRLADGRLEAIPASRLAHWQKELGRYLANGNRLPGPWSHIDEKGQPIVMGQDGTLPRSDINAGFWDKFAIETDPELGATLVAEIEADEAEASKIGTKVRETSIYVRPEYTDGHGNVYKDIPLHIALVTHPIQPGQTNFEPVSQGLALAMSQRAFSMATVPQSVSNDKGTPPSSTPNKTDAPVSDPSSGQPLIQNASNPGIDQVIASLRRCGIVLPPDTNDQNFLSYLMVALGQKSAGEQPDETNPYQPPEGAVQKQPAPVAMSAITAEQFQGISREVFMSHPVAQELVNTNKALQTHLNEQAKEARRSRIAGLLSSGRITKEYADAQLTPLVDSFQMSLGSSVPQPLDAVLAALEAAPAPASQQQPPNFRNALLNNSLAMSQGGVSSPANPFVAGSETVDAGAVIDAFFKNTSPAV